MFFMHSTNVPHNPIGAPKKDTVSRKLRLQYRVSRQIDRTAKERGISYSDVVNLLLVALGKGEQPPFPFALEP